MLCTFAREYGEYSYNKGHLGKSMPMAWRRNKHIISYLQEQMQKSLYPPLRLPQ